MIKRVVSAQTSPLFQFIVPLFVATQALFMFNGGVSTLRRVWLLGGVSR